MSENDLDYGYCHCNGCPHSGYCIECEMDMIQKKEIMESLEKIKN